jgi:monolysocardiolipin acyltransferase
MSTVGAASRAFLYGLNKVEVTGLDNLLGVLDRRKNGQRERGLLTVCNHVSVYGVSMKSRQCVITLLTSQA